MTTSHAYPGPMTIGPQPRRAVIDAAWREIGPGLELLSSPDGGPLSRAVKRIIDPLVLRLRAHPEYSAPVVAADIADEMRQIIFDHAVQLRAAAQWFALLKAQRRRDRITTGNAQELYFPVCFELAATRGEPGQDDSPVVVEALRDVHGDRDRTAVERLHEYLADPAVLETLSRQLDAGWDDVRAGSEPSAPFLAGLTTVLGPSGGHNADAARQRVWTALIGDTTPYNFGARMRDASAAAPGRSTRSDCALPHHNRSRRSRVPARRNVRWTAASSTVSGRRCAVPSTAMSCPTCRPCAPKRRTVRPRRGGYWQRTTRPPWSPASRSGWTWHRSR